MVNYFREEIANDVIGQLKDDNFETPAKFDDSRLKCPVIQLVKQM